VISDKAEEGSSLLSRRLNKKMTILLWKRIMWNLYIWPFIWLRPNHWSKHNFSFFSFFHIFNTMTWLGFQIWRNLTWIYKNSITLLVPKHYFSHSSHWIWDLMYRMGKTFAEHLDDCEKGFRLSFYAVKGR
jgi:hypothetical protein